MRTPSESAFGYVGIGTTSPGAALDVNGTVKATKFSTSAGWTAIPNVGSWTSNASCRIVGSFLQIKGGFTNSSASTYWGTSGLSLPAACLVQIYSSNGGISLFSGSTNFTNLSFAGTFPAD